MQLNLLERKNIFTWLQKYKHYISLKFCSCSWQNVGKRFPATLLKMSVIHGTNSWMCKWKIWNHIQPKQKKIAALSASLWKIPSFLAMLKTLKSAGITHTSLKCHVHSGREKSPQVLITTKKCSHRNQSPGFLYMISF